jgi:hypothetical protein
MRNVKSGSRKIDIVERKRELAAQDPIPPEFGFGITIQVLRTYKSGRFSDLDAAVQRARTKFLSEKGEL